MIIYNNKFNHDRLLNT